MAITEVYVDPAIAADSGTGTIGDPYGDLQYALNTVTRDATNGNRFNIKAGTAEVLTAALSLATYGTPGNTSPLVFQGYTSAAGDGGIGEISGAGSYAIFLSSGNGNKGFITFADLKLGNCGATTAIGFRLQSSLINCEIHTCTANPGVLFETTGAHVAAGCYFNDLVKVQSAVTSTFFGNRFYCDSSTDVLDLGGIGSVALNNLFVLATDTSMDIIDATGAGCSVIGNTIYCTSANTRAGIVWDSRGGGIVANNVIVGNSGTGGKGIWDAYGAGRLVTGGNAFYNNATNISVGAQWTYELNDNLALASDPFVDAANGDFAIDSASDAIEAAWPSAWYGLATTTSLADIGAVQNGAGAGGGGGGPVIGSRIIRGLGAV